MDTIFTVVLVAAVCYLLYRQFRQHETSLNTEGKRLQEVTDWLLAAGVDLLHPLFYAIIARDPGDVKKELESLHRNLSDEEVRETKLRRMRRAMAKGLLAEGSDRAWLYEMVEEAQAEDARAAKKIETAAQRKK